LPPGRWPVPIVFGVLLRIQGVGLVILAGTLIACLD
jgi:hypothetical protein